MKYVRTKYGEIYKIEKRNILNQRVIKKEDGYYVVINEEPYEEYCFIEKDDIVKESTNLNNIIDEIVVQDIDDNYRILSVGIYSEKDTKYVYGAIYTEDCLKYVTIFNNGKWELI